MSLTKSPAFFPSELTVKTDPPSGTVIQYTYNFPSFPSVNLKSFSERIRISHRYRFFRQNGCVFRRANEWRQLWLSHSVHVDKRNDTDQEFVHTHKRAAIFSHLKSHGIHCVVCCVLSVVWGRIIFKKCKNHITQHSAPPHNTISISTVSCGT